VPTSAYLIRPCSGPSVALRATALGFASLLALAEHKDQLINAKDERTKLSCRLDQSLRCMGGAVCGGVPHLTWQRRRHKGTGGS